MGEKYQKKDYKKRLQAFIIFHKSTNFSQTLPKLVIKNHVQNGRSNSNPDKANSGNF